MAPRRTRTKAAWILPLLALLALHAACSADGTACYSGDYRYCDCPSDRRGYEQCDARGDAYGACDCSGNLPPHVGILVDAGAPEAAAPSDGGLLPLLSPCSSDSDCASNLCFAFNAYGPHCSIRCAKDADCPAPSPGCSNKGVCKLH